MTFFLILIFSWIVMISVFAWSFAEIKLGKKTIQNEDSLEFSEILTFKKINSVWEKKIKPVINKNTVAFLLLIKKISKKVVQKLEKFIHRQVHKLGYVHKNVTPLDEKGHKMVS